jgi:hypothetical protein
MIQDKKRACEFTGLSLVRPEPGMLAPAVGAGILFGHFANTKLEES